MLPVDLPVEVRAGPFRRQDALVSGLTLGQLRGPAFEGLRRASHVHACAERGDDFDARAWMSLLPDNGAMYGLTAAWWYGLPVPPSEEFHVIVPVGVVPRRRRGLVPHEGVHPDEVRIFRGLRVTTPERTWLDLSLILHRTDLVVVGDAMVRAGLTTPDQLIDASDRARRRRHIVGTRKCARLVRQGVDSPPETRVRLIIADGGLPEPEVNSDVFDDAGGWIGRPDLAYVALKLALQYEGDVHRVNQKRWRSDIARDESFRESGWEVIRITADDLKNPARLCDRIHAAMARQRARLADTSR